MAKEPTYTPREEEALRSAYCIVARVCSMGEWREQSFSPEGTEKTARDVLLRVQRALRHHRDLSKVVLYAEGTHNGQVMRACVPHDFIPSQLR